MEYSPGSCIYGWKSNLSSWALQCDILLLVKAHFSFLPRDFKARLWAEQKSPFFNEVIRCHLHITVNYNCRSSITSAFRMGFKMYSVSFSAAYRVSQVGALNDKAMLVTWSLIENKMNQNWLQMKAVTFVYSLKGVYDKILTLEVFKPLGELYICKQLSFFLSSKVLWQFHIYIFSFLYIAAL